MKPRYYTLKQLARYSSLSTNTLRQYIKDEGLPHFRMKNRILVRIDEFDQWMERYRRKITTREEELNRIVDEVMKDLGR